MRPRIFLGATLALLTLSSLFFTPQLFAQDAVQGKQVGSDGSRSSFNQADIKRMNRMWADQYRFQQEVMRQEYYNWIGHDPYRPVVNATPNFGVPYGRFVMPWVPVSRTYYYGSSYPLY